MASGFFDTNNFDYFSFSSLQLSFIYLQIQIFVSIFLLVQLYHHKNRLHLPEVEEILGDLYLNCKNNHKSIYTMVLYNLKLQLIMLFLFIFQDYPNIEIAITSSLYSCSLLYLIFIRPFDNNLDLVQTFIKEQILMSISVMF